MPERNLFFFVVILGLEITYLLISYLMGKKKLICVCITKHAGKEARCCRPVLFICQQWQMFISVFPPECCMSIWIRLCFCLSRQSWSLHPANHIAPPIASGLVTLITLPAHFRRDCSIWLSLAPKSNYITNWCKISGFLSEHW